MSKYRSNTVASGLLTVSPVLLKSVPKHTLRVLRPTIIITIQDYDEKGYASLVNDILYATCSVGLDNGGYIAQKQRIDTTKRKMIIRENPVHP